MPKSEKTPVLFMIVAVIVTILAYSFSNTVFQMPTYVHEPRTMLVVLEGANSMAIWARIGVILTAYLVTIKILGLLPRSTSD